MQPETADRWLDAWDLEAAGRGLSKDRSYWQAGWDWIARSASIGIAPSEDAPGAPDGGQVPPRGRLTEHPGGRCSTVTFCTDSLRPAR